MKISILDQSPVTAASSPREAVRQTLDLAVAADKLGYHRFWVSEHHNSMSFASASPEIMLTRIAGMTERIRVGSGGVLLGHYSPLKIAEQFRLLECFYPGRIDLGLGRASGADKLATSALHNGGELRDGGFERVAELRRLLAAAPRKDSSYNAVHASPMVESQPEIWILGTSPASAQYAAEHGLPYAFGAFINHEHLVPALETYHRNFRPSAVRQKPYVNLAVFAVACDSEERARQVIKTSELWVVRSFLHKQNVVFPSMAEAAAHSYTPNEELVLQFRRQAAVYGSVDKVASTLRNMTANLMADELTIITITEQFQDRLRSYELLAQALIEREAVSA